MCFGDPFVHGYMFFHVLVGLCHGMEAVDVVVLPESRAVGIFELPVEPGRGTDTVHVGALPCPMCVGRLWLPIG